MSADNQPLIDTEVSCEDSTQNEEQLEPLNTVDIDESPIVTADNVNNEIVEKKLEETIAEPVETLKNFEILQKCLETVIYDKMAVHYKDLGLKNIDTPVDTVINQIYDQTVQYAVATYQEEHGLSNLGYEETVDVLKSRFTSLLSNYLDVHQKVIEFHSQLETQLEPYVESATSLQLIKKLKEIKEILVTGQASPYNQLNDLAQDVCEVWCNNYRHVLDQIMENEHTHYQHHKNFILSKARGIYHEKMSTITNQEYVSPKKLSELHSNFLGSFIAIIKDVLMTKEEHQGDLNELINTLTAQLNFYFEEFKHENRAKLAQLQKTADQIITQQKKVYCDKMEDVLKREDKFDLFAIHQGIVAEVKQNLEFEMANRIHNKEPCQNYILSLEKSIEKYWRSFQHIHKSQEEKKAEFPSTPSLSGNCSRENSSRPSNWTAPPVPFIVFHLSLSKITVTIPKGNDITPFCSQPLLVGQRLDGQLDICEDYNELKTKSEEIFKIGELLTGNIELKGAQIVKINNNPIEVSVELLLGFIFDTLKRQVESQYKSFVESCVIIIPFWLTSFQRQQIIDGGKIAQFKKTRLINENLAIAMHAYTTNPDHEIFVLSENSQRVNATIYSVGDSIEDLRVIGHCGDYEVTKGTTVQEKITKACILAQSQTTSGVKIIKNIVKSRILQGNPALRLLFMSYETSDWKLYLQVAKINISNATFTKECCWESVAAEKGAILLARNFESLTKTLRDQLSSNIQYSVHPPVNPRTDYIYFARKEYAELFSQTPCGVVSRTLPDHAREALFYHESKYNGKLHEIGKLVIKENLTKVQLEMVIDFQLVPKFLNVNGDKESAAFSWTPCHFNEQRINQIISVMNSSNNNIVSEPNSQADEENNLKEELKRNLKNVYDRISNGEGKFRTDMGRDMALQQITESLGVLDSSVSLKVTESQQKIYDRITNKYFPA